MARPSKYTSDLMMRSFWYIESYSALGDAIPSLTGLAKFLGISRETVHAWRRDPEKAEFSDIYGRLMDARCERLINGGLSAED